MKVIAQDTGDLSVGINPGTVEIDFKDMSARDFDKESRNFIRKQISDLLVYLCYIKPIYVTFEDECPDCGKIKELNKKCNCLDYENIT